MPTIKCANAMKKSPAPTRAELLAAVNRRVPDVIAPGLKVLFCGINPGLYSAWSRHHFARPGNRFWPALFASGFSKRLLHPSQEHELLRYGYGITNIVRRPTLAADELTREELVAGFRKLRHKVRTYRPVSLAVLGLSAYRVAFDRPDTKLGMQPDRIGDTVVWVLPNPSGLNAHFTPGTLATLFRDFRLALERF